MINNYTVQHANEAWPAILFFAAIIGCMIAAAVYKSWADRKRRDAFRDWASKNRFEFREGPDHGLETKFPRFDFLRQGFDRRARFIVEGRCEAGNFISFDWHYKTRVRTKNGTRTVHHSFTVVAVESAVPMEPMVIRPEGFLDKIGEFFGGGDIDFESAEFSRAYHVTCADRRWAYDMLHPAAIQHLLDSPRGRIDFSERHAATRGSGLMSIEEISRSMRTIGGLLQLMPRHVVQERMEKLRNAPPPPEAPRLTGVAGMVQGLAEQLQKNARDYGRRD